MFAGFALMLSAHNGRMIGEIGRLGVDFRDWSRVNCDY